MDFSLKKNGGDKSIDNGAILTKRAHVLLNALERCCPDAYNDLQKVFGNDIPIMRSFELYLGRLSYYWKLYKDKNNGNKKT